jgi:hypothetical protein
MAKKSKIGAYYKRSIFSKNRLRNPYYNMILSAFAVAGAVVGLMISPLLGPIVGALIMIIIGNRAIRGLKK